MKRSIRLALSRFPPGTIPASLLQQTAISPTPLDVINVPLQEVCHHKYLDTYGRKPPRPNPFADLCADLLTECPALEFMTNGLGSHKEAKVGELMSWGKAFCRWFLHDHIGMVHFAHLDHVMGRPAGAPFNDVTVERAADGDTPDYLCADGSNRVCLAEAKGRTSSVRFENSDFGEWRKQVQRVRVRKSDKSLLRVKGYIVATRFRTETHGPNIRSHMCAEDPSTEGIDEPTTDERSAIASVVRAQHYAGVFWKLGYPLQSAALSFGFQAAPRRRVMAGIWRPLIPSLSQLQFVGGFVGPEFPQGSLPRWARPTRRSSIWNPDLTSTGPAFFGLERNVFDRMLAASRSSSENRDTQAPAAFEPTQQDMPDEMSFLRDGTLMTQPDLMWFERVEVT